MEYIIGIDSGGTSTRAAAYDLDGLLIKEVKTGFGNLLIDVKQALVNIRSAIEGIWRELNEADCKMIVLGAAGVDSGNFTETIHDYFSSYSQEMVIVNDALLAHYALLNGESGCLIIAGTGSICIGRNNNETARVGGWGNILGDEGSGYSIAKNVIKRVLEAHDTGRIYSPLEENFLKQAGFKTPFEILKYVYTSSKDKVAEFANIVSVEALKGDKEAVEILTLAGEDLANQTSLLLNKLNLFNKPKVAVTGSVLLKNDIVYHAFERALKKKYTSVEFIRNDISNTIGGFYYYQKHNS